MTRIVSFARSTVLAAGLVALSSGSGVAQHSAGDWQGWLGCWTAGPAIGGIAPSAIAPLVCVLPTSDANVVEVATVSGDSVVSTQRIDASGRERPLGASGCSGTQRAWWSADGRRVYLKAVATCAGVERVTSGIIAMSPAGEWLDVQGVAGGGDEGVRVARYRDIGVSAVPEQVAAALRVRGVVRQGVRHAAGATIGSSAVIDASRSVSPAVVEAWLLERGQVFALDARELVRLADADVPARVTDAMVAVSNPDVFAVARADERARNRARSMDDDVAGRRIYVYMDPRYSPYGWGYAPYGYGYGPYGYSALGYGRGYGSGYYGGGYGPPIIVVTPDARTTRGRAVKGRGYTQTEPGSGTATPTSTRDTQGSSGSSSSSGSSGQSGRSDPAPRTASPKP